MNHLNKFLNYQGLRTIRCHFRTKHRFHTYNLSLRVRQRNFIANSSCVQQCHINSRNFSCSSTSALHKVLFVNAAGTDEPPPEGIQSDISNSLVNESANIKEKTSNLINEELISEKATNASQGIEYIPPPPVPPEGVDELLTLNALGEPTFSCLGLGGWTPVGLMQNTLEFFHVTFNLPWWGTIAVVTVIIRACLFPLIIKSRRNGIKMAKVMPGFQKIQERMTEARLTGDNLEATKVAYQLQEYAKKNDVSPLKNLYPMLIQAPIFISMFMSLRKCANLPVESFQTGGLFWFTDLTIADPYFLLPIITSATMLLTIEFGVDVQNPSASMGSKGAIYMKYFMRAMPIIAFPFILNFPAAILCYWTTTNFVSLGQVGLLNIPSVKERLGLIMPPNLGEIQTKKSKGFRKELRESWLNAKLTDELRTRHQVDEVKFKKAGQGPLVKTYKHNPLVKPPIYVKAKEKD